ncbi:peroxidase 57-like [Chenopodium quinoa]|uniref:peroxidase 57-like n=1 Tax=Chenopodium quinoa TaxID=63459 RepID=UPI000B78871F|nr:peroxidase 57-like [Chenopodium quinoa]
MGLLYAPLSRLGLTLVVVLIILTTSQNVDCKRHNLLSVEAGVVITSNDRPNPPPKPSPSNDRPNPPPKPSPSIDPPITPSSSPPSPLSTPPIMEPPSPPSPLPTPPIMEPPSPPSPLPTPPIIEPSSPPLPIDDTFTPVPSIDSPLITPSPEAYPPLLPPPLAPSPSPVGLPPLLPPHIPPVVAPYPPTVDPPPSQVPSPKDDAHYEEPSNPALSPPSPTVPPPPHSPSRPPSTTLSPPPLSKPSPSPPLRPSSPNSYPSTSNDTPKLQVGYYQGKCSNKSMDVEALISTIVEEHFLNDTSILPALLRLQFHDCFVHGCDASILIEGNATEKTAIPNLTVRGYELIDTIKASIEEECPGIVSCADIIAVATNVVIKLGGGPEYLAQTGRRDGIISNDEDVDLPSPTLTVQETIDVFQAKNFTAEEMVVLLGAHTVGIAHCISFEDRLYSGTSQFDPTMDPTLREQLSETCPQGQFSNNFALLNQNPQHSGKVDNTFYNQILKQRGILSIDQALANDPLTKATVVQLSLNATLFNVALANAMVKLQAVDVLTGDQGEIRNVCSKFN